MEQSELDKLLAPEYHEGQATEEPAPSEPPATSQEEPIVETATEPAPAEPTETPVASTSPAPEGGEEMVPKSQYDALRVDYTKKATELADLKRRPAVVESQEEAPKAPTPEAGIKGFIQSEIEKGIAEVLAPIEQRERTLALEETVVGLSNKYADFEKVAPSFIEAIEANPEILDIPNGLEILFQAKRSDYLEKEGQAIAIAKEQEKAAIVAQKKQVTDTGAVGSNQGAPAGKSESDKILEGILGTGKSGSIFNLGG